MNDIKKIVRHGSRGHALCSASSSHRWLNCSGSVALCREVPKRTSIYAEEGTKAHEVAEIVLSEILEIKTDKVMTEIPEEMFLNIKKYISFVQGKAKEFDKEPIIRIEKKLTLYKDLNMWGTADVVMVGIKDGAYHGKVIDLKYGKTPVEALNNPQLSYYGAALIKTAQEQKPGVLLDSVEVSIYQPRIDKPVRGFNYTHADLMAWIGVLTRGAEKAIYQVIGITPREFKKGDWCKWCDAKSKCPLMKSEKDTIQNIDGCLEFLD